VPQSKFWYPGCAPGRRKILAPPMVEIKSWLRPCK